MWTLRSPVKAVHNIVEFQTLTGKNRSETLRPWRLIVKAALAVILWIIVVPPVRRFSLETQTPAFVGNT